MPTKNALLNLLKTCTYNLISLKNKRRDGLQPLPSTEKESPVDDMRKRSSEKLCKSFWETTVPEPKKIRMT